MIAKAGVAPGWCRLTGTQEKLLKAISEDGTLRAERQGNALMTTYTLKQAGRTTDCKESDVYALVKHKLVKNHPQDPHFCVVLFTPTSAGMLRASLVVEKKRRG